MKCKYISTNTFALHFRGSTGTSFYLRQSGAHLIPSESYWLLIPFPGDVSKHAERQEYVCTVRGKMHRTVQTPSIWAGNQPWQSASLWALAVTSGPDCYISTLETGRHTSTILVAVMFHILKNFMDGKKNISLQKIEPLLYPFISKS